MPSHGKLTQSFCIPTRVILLTRFSDGGLPASPFFSRVHPKLNVPLNSLYLNLALVTIFGCIFLGSSSAFNAIVSASVVLLDISYAMPIAVNCLRGRRMLPERSFTLASWFGWTINMVCCYKKRFDRKTIANIRFLDLGRLYLSDHNSVPLPSLYPCYW